MLTTIFWQHTDFWQHTEHTEQRPEFVGDLGDPLRRSMQPISLPLKRTTKYNVQRGDRREGAGKIPSEALRSLRALRANVVISFHGVRCPVHDDSVVNPSNG